MKGLARIRKEQGLTQRAFAALLGTSPSLVAQWETGKVSPRLTSLEAAARILRCTVDDLIDGGTGR